MFGIQQSAGSRPWFTTTLARLAAQDAGQDLVEYALLTGAIAFAGYAVLTVLGVDIFNTYWSWVDPATGTPTLWDPPAPSGS